MMEKLGPTIGKIDETAITLIGYPTTGTTFSPDTTYKPYPPFSRLSFRRILARYTFVKNVLTIRPRVVIFTTHELLLPSLIAKLITGCRLVYDVQENYFRNIRYSKTFPPLLKQLIATWVRLKEILISPAIDHFLLAEAAYHHELGFISNRFTILQNKVSKSAVQQHTLEKKSKSDQLIHLIFSGTLAKGTGVFEAIRWTKKLYTIEPRIRLTIIGYCSSEDERAKLRQEIEGCPCISLIGGDTLVPHHIVMEEISKSDAGFITYPINPSVSSAIPTKLFEYLAFQLPILIVPHPPWIDYCMPYSAAIELDDARRPEEILAQLQASTFYTRTPENIFWENQEESLRGVIRELLIVE